MITKLSSASAFLGAIASSIVPARSESVAATWDAYFYAAPRTNSRVLDEVQRETKLDVQACENGWCRVRYGDADGYVKEDIVRGPKNDVWAKDRAFDEVCFTAVQPGGGAWQDERFCRSGR